MHIDQRNSRENAAEFPLVSQNRLLLARGLVNADTGHIVIADATRNRIPDNLKFQSLARKVATFTSRVGRP